MIFDWENYFSEKLVLGGIDLEDNVSSITRNIDYISGFVKDGNDDYLVSICIDDNFRIESVECECGKSKCCHMTALLHALNYSHNKDIEYADVVDSLDKDKLIEFVKDQITYNEDSLDDFKDKFKNDYLHHELLSYEDELFAIFDYYGWEDDLKIYIENDLMECYESKEYRYTLFLITLLFGKLIDRHSFDEEADLKKSYDTVVDLIEKIAMHHEDLVFDFLYHCLIHNYSAMYPPFLVLMKFFNDNFKDDKYMKRKEELFLRG